MGFAKSAMDSMKVTRKALPRPGSISGSVKDLTVTGKVTDIRTAVIGGESVYYIKLDSSESYYSVKAADFENIVLVNDGDTVTLTVTTAKGTIIPVSGLK